MRLTLFAGIAVITVGAIAAALAFDGPRGPYAGAEQPVWAPRPAGIPARPGAAVCGPAADGLPHVLGTERPWVDADPTGATIVWVPGMNAKRCRAVITHVDAAHARHFAAAARAAKPYPPGDYACPMEDESAATVFLTYRGRADAEVIQVRLTGCTGLTAPHRSFLAGGDVKDLGPVPHGVSAFA